MNLLKKKNKIIYVSFICYILLYFLLIVRVLPQFSTLINAIFILAVSSFILYKYKRFEFTKVNKRITKLVFISLIIYFTVVYLLGLFTGYGRDVFSSNIFTIIKNSFLPLISVISLEYIRYLFISNNNDSKKKIYFFTILIIFFDIILNYYIFDFTLVNFFIFITVTVLPIIFKNILLSYITHKIGYYPCLVYVVPICLYAFVAPYKPILGNYLTCIINIAYPALVYIYTSRIISEGDRKKRNIGKVLKVILLDIPLLLVFTLFVGLISGFFKYHLIGVDTSEIKPKINKGDAVLINRNYNYDNYKKGDIIAYKSGKKIIIDKISKKSKDEYGSEIIYVTKIIIKGKKNKYKKIDESIIIGKYVNFKIKKIAKPTIWFKEFIGGDLNN